MDQHNPCSGEQSVKTHEYVKREQPVQALQFKGRSLDVDRIRCLFPSLHVYYMQGDLQGKLFKLIVGEEGPTKNLVTMSPTDWLLYDRSTKLLSKLSDSEFNELYQAKV